jgi:hypothetical protein
MAMNAKCAELESRAIQAERTIKLLDQQIQTQDNISHPASPKRRRVTPVARSSRTKVPQATGDETTEHDMDVLEDNLGDGKVTFQSFDFAFYLCISLDGQQLVGHMWTFQKLFLRPESDPEAICASLIGMAASLGLVFTAIAKRYDHLAVRTRTKPTLPSLGKDKSELACTISACTRAFVMLLVGLDGLEEDSPGRRLPSLVIYECVNMFHSALAAIETAASQSARMQIITQPKAGSRAAPSFAKTSVAAHGIAQLLVTLVGRLEPNNSAHQKLFDGFAFILFERVSKRLYYCTFGRHRSASIADDIVASVALTDLKESVRPESEALAIRYEVKELVVILERAMGIAPNHMNSQVAKKNATKLSRTLSLKTLTSSKVRLNPLAKDRLQRTLIVSMFGYKVDNDFLNILTMPVRPASLPTLPKIDNNDIEEWYQKQVWRLVGWDILTKEDTSEWTK